ncbi:MAG: SUMF1/EgtB/PvdO family nonheme iron enzyme [Rivularia sp. T60_A2020_040]|nr:SUMF1/EgtB/PvdO family nonheme iron enzyme [Rivularia sp. T60_A2020_040]
MGKNSAIAIGINYYYNLQPLKYAQRDAKAMENWFKQEARFDQVFLFTEDSQPIPASPQPIPTQPSFANFYGFLEKQFEKSLLKPEDNLWFFFAGHGRRYRDQDYLMFLDSSPAAVDRTAISVDYVTQRLRRSGADNVVLFIDACRDEGDRGGLGIGEEEHQGVITFYSCNAYQKSWEIDALKHGAFTYALLEGLNLRGEGNCATVERLARHLYHRVPQLNTNHQQQLQNPYFKADPPYKMYFILLKQSATFQDAQPLIDQAQEAELDGDLLLAETLWQRLWGIPGVDRRAFAAIKRIAVKKTTQNQIPTQKPIIPTPETATSSRGVTPTETPSTQETKLKVFPFEVVTVNSSGQEVKREQGEAEYFTEDLGNGVILEMVSIPGGSFKMGSPPEEKNRSDTESPQHDVTVPAFFMGKFEVTQEQYQQVMAKNPSNFKGDKRPVKTVSWNDAVEFCKKLSQKTGRTYRLPSEAEWEYACRAGTTTPFYFGETITSELANYRASNTYALEAKGVFRGETTPVGKFPPNGFGLYDMHGNVWEWCQDTWHDNYNDAPTDGSAWINNDNPYRVLRGGSWFNNPYYCRSASLFNSNERDKDVLNVFGFRVVYVVERTS